MTHDTARPVGAVTGADKQPEADDPMELVGVAYPVASAEDADRTLARCFVEEYALLGWDAGRIRALFQSPLYGGPYGIFRRHGMAFVESVLREVFDPEGR
jgi:hypothetical protein